MTVNGRSLIVVGLADPYGLESDAASPLELTSIDDIPTSGWRWLQRMIELGTFVSFPYSYQI